MAGHNTAVKPPEIFRYDREPPKHWVDSLRSISPFGHPTGWLELFWAPGTPDQPVQRWVVYEATPASESERRFIEDYYRESAPETADQRRVWKYYQQHGAILRGAWVIQGKNGGHPYRFTETEQKLRSLLNLEPDSPEAGDPEQPYAEWDIRVMLGLLALDYLRKGAKTIAESKKEERQRLAREYREKLVKFWGDYSESLVAPDATQIASKAIDEGKFERVDTDPVPDLESIEQRYIEEGVYTNDQKGL